jgi:hypothetical protein
MRSQKMVVHMKKTGAVKEYACAHITKLGVPNHAKAAVALSIHGKGAGSGSKTKKYTFASVKEREEFCALIRDLQKSGSLAKSIFDELTLGAEEGHEGVVMKTDLLQRLEGCRQTSEVVAGVVDRILLVEGDRIQFNAFFPFFLDLYRNVSTADFASMWGGIEGGPTSPRNSTGDGEGGDGGDGGDGEGGERGGGGGDGGGDGGGGGGALGNGGGSMRSGSGSSRGKRMPSRQLSSVMTAMTTNMLPGEECWCKAENAALISPGSNLAVRGTLFATSYRLYFAAYRSVVVPDQIGMGNVSSLQMDPTRRPEYVFTSCDIPIFMIDRLTHQAKDASTLVFNCKDCRTVRFSFDASTQWVTTFFTVLSQKCFSQTGQPPFPFLHAIAAARDDTPSDASIAAGGVGGGVLGVVGEDAAARNGDANGGDADGGESKGSGGGATASDGTSGGNGGGNGGDVAVQVDGLEDTQTKGQGGGQGVGQENLESSQSWRLDLIAEYHRLGLVTRTSSEGFGRDSGGSGGSGSKGGADVDSKWSTPYRSSRWRVVDNSNFDVCGTYPQHLVFPRSFLDPEVAQVAKFRSARRLVVVTWRHPSGRCVMARSSQPLVGVASKRSPADERLLNLLRLNGGVRPSSSSPSSSSSPRHNGAGGNAADRGGAVGGLGRGALKARGYGNDKAADPTEDGGSGGSGGGGGEGGDGDAVASSTSRDPRARPLSHRRKRTYT